MANKVGCTFIFSETHDTIEHNNGTKIDMVRFGGLKWLPNHLSPSATTAVTRDVIHQRLGHLHEDSILTLERLGIKGVTGYSKLLAAHFCPSCAIGKSKVTDINRQSTRGNDPLAPFHTIALDIWGTMSSPDINGNNKWVLGAACYKTATILCALMKSKSDAPAAWKGFIETIKSMDFVLRRVRIDNDSVFLSSVFTQLCEN
jgi:hypothetical protein